MPYTPADWSNTGTTIKLPEHTANLPDVTDTVYDTPSFTDFPFYGAGPDGQGNDHWGIRGSDDRWECDDHPGDDGNDTLHQIWFR